MNKNGVRFGKRNPILGICVTFKMAPKNRFLWADYYSFGKVLPRRNFDPTVDFLSNYMFPAWEHFKISRIFTPLTRNNYVGNIKKKTKRLLGNTYV